MCNTKKERVIVYVDGFNFYYGIKNKGWRQFYWIDIVSLFEQFLRPDQELIDVKYFSAKVWDLEKGKRQNALFQANKENPKFKLILGKYLKKQITCFNCNNVINTYEEKESDVRIATQVVADAYQDNYDIAIIVSADSDMIPAIELAKEAKKRVFVYFPPNQSSSHLQTASSGNPIRMERYKSRFSKSILPDEITLKNNEYKLSIPDKWKTK
ncbi:MAG: NYN domain-containing protein [Rikenellaceae bacterium]